MPLLVYAPRKDIGLLPRKAASTVSVSRSSLVGIRVTALFV